MPTIRGLRARAVRVPMERPHRTAGGVVSEAPLVLTDVYGDDGSAGQSIVFAYTTTALGPIAALIRNLEDLLKGEPLAPVEVERTLSRRFRLLGTQGLVGIALAAIDMALWDALARRLGTSLVGLLGGVARPIPAYGPVGFDGSARSAEEAAGWADRGFKGVKAKIGHPTVEEDLAVVRAIRGAVGDGVAIMVDYNQCLTPAEAVRRLQALDHEGLTWVEEPTLAHDFAGLAEVARQARTPIQAGENWWGPLDFRNAIAARASDLVMPDLMKVGGVTGWLRASAIAQAENLPLSNHLWPEVSAQLLCLSPTAHWLEYADWWNPILADPLRVEGGMAIVDGVIGSGVAWNEEAVGRHAV